MESIRKWFYKPKKGDRSLLAQFFYADDELNAVAAELDSFDGKKDPQRCTALVNHLRQCQDKVLTICIKIMDELIPGERASRDFRVKFPDDVIQDNLAGQLWFGAECLSAGSSIMNREAESGAMRPLARALTKSLEKVRGLLRDASLCSDQTPPCLRNLIASLCTFDHLLAEFELRYVSAMVPVKTAHEYELQQLVVVLFSETLQRALVEGLLTQDMVDDYDPALMFTIPRLAIVSGLLFYPYMSPLSLDQNATNMSDMFRPFRSLLMKIRELLLTLSDKELSTLERMLCSSDEVKFEDKLSVKNHCHNQLSSQETSDEECLSSSTTELVMDNSVTTTNTITTTTTTTTIERCSTKGFPAQDLMNNNKNPSSVKRKPFGSTAIISNRNDLQNNELKSPVSSSTMTTSSRHIINDDDRLESGSVPDSDLTESLATATEALTEILVKKTTVIEQHPENCVVVVVDSNGNNNNDMPSSPVIPKQPNVSSSSTQTECTASHVCCCSNEWKCWKSTAADINGSSGTAAVSSVQCQCQSTASRCCHRHRRKKTVAARVSCSSSSEMANMSGDKINNSCQCTVVVPKYSKSWRELRNKQRSNVICRFQTCNNRSSSKSSSAIKKHEMCSSCSSCTTSSADESDESVTDSTSTNSSCNNNYSLRRQKARAKFRSDEDLLHRLFVCISGVADQLQTNFAGDLRNILKAVFLMSNSNCSTDNQQNTDIIPGINNQTAVMIENGEEALVWRDDTVIGDVSSTTAETPPPWVPDHEAPVCMSCKAIFTVVRRRHHCRNCGKVFCSRCSSNSVPLPRFGHLKPVRVCNRCFIYQVTPFTLEPSIGPVSIALQS
ncbi:Zinc finger, FYVE/PHD-type,FYVE zinc finger,Zinc finger, FYVE-related,Zinc finger, RING/FYVE/PHD-type [Cinara cedri]|uniref:Lateral signaling target protein 2 homolog n=1 Tax=Cinara cedri TaxID=506608 RepID=A0A5E4N8S3_9HEMI|nr:Zinc finger, FYVE/PHD-type,FYVE zinc finger,Zinc finger, FYVE-related,Zinc finger, RING/FYVE/PHD-type [Cinara cedri]